MDYATYIPPLRGTISTTLETVEPSTEGLPAVMLSYSFFSERRADGQNAVLEMENRSSLESRDFLGDDVP